MSASRGVIYARQAARRVVGPINLQRLLTLMDVKMNHLCYSIVCRSVLIHHSHRKRQRGVDSKAFLNVTRVTQLNSQKKIEALLVVQSARREGGLLCVWVLYKDCLVRE